jgi:hypothetical protein
MRFLEYTLYTLAHRDNLTEALQFLNALLECIPTQITRKLQDSFWHVIKNIKNDEHLQALIACLFAGSFSKWEVQFIHNLLLGAYEAAPDVMTKSCRDKLQRVFPKLFAYSSRYSSTEEWIQSLDAYRVFDSLFVLINVSDLLRVENPPKHLYERAFIIFSQQSHQPEDVGGLLSIMPMSGIISLLLGMTNDEIKKIHPFAIRPIVSILDKDLTTWEVYLKDYSHASCYPIFLDVIRQALVQRLSDRNATWTSGAQLTTLVALMTKYDLLKERQYLEPLEAILNNNNLNLWEVFPLVIKSAIIPLDDTKRLWAMWLQKKLPFSNDDVCVCVKCT